MKILFINNDGGGFADQIEIDSGTTVKALRPPDEGERERLPDPCQSPTRCL